MWGLWESPTPLEAAILVLDHGKVRGCFILYIYPVRWRLSESCIISERVCLSKGMEHTTWLQEKKPTAAFESNYQLVQAE